MRVLVADDEPLARRRLVTLLQRRPEVTAIEEAGDGEATLQALRRASHGLVFLDVQMPGLDGLQVIREVGAEAMPAVVFVTAFDRHAVAAFDVGAVDYLLKPFDDERFGEAFERALRRLAGEALTDDRQRLSALLSRLGRQAPAADHVTVTKGERTMLLSCAEIDWVQAAGNYVEVHARGETFLVRATLERVATSLAPPRFLRIHRSAIVNVARVAELRPLPGGDQRVFLVDGTTLRMSRRYRRNLPSFGGTL